MYNRHSQYACVKDETLDTLDRYAQHGVPTGDFLRAVLSNDCMNAVCRADYKNKVTLYEICLYIYNEMPSDCHGSPAHYKAWLEKFLCPKCKGQGTILNGTLECSMCKGTGKAQQQNV